MQLNDWFNLAIILITIAGVAMGRFPVFRMNRATIALVGSAILVTSGAMALEEAYQLIDMNTIILLFSMMVINVNLRLAGFFRYIADHIIRFSGTPTQLLMLIVFSAGILSGFFLNDTIVIMFTPLVLEIVLVLKRNPIPYIIGLAAAANAGSAATIVGNPQNMIIGVASRIPFTEFTLHLLPPSMLALVVVVLVVRIMFRGEFSEEIILPERKAEIRIFKPLMLKSSVALILMVTAFFCGIPVTMAAFGAASLLLITRRIKPERVFLELDWSLLLFFCGLFVVTGMLHRYIAGFGGFFDPSEAIGRFSLAAIILSNLISNVPAVLVLAPFVKAVSDPQKYWLLLAMTTTFAGNLTLLGSVANLIVAEIARKRGVILSFSGYLKAGVPITLFTTSIGVAWLYFFV